MCRSMGQSKKDRAVNIMRVKKFQRDFEAAESRALEAESTLDSF